MEHIFYNAILKRIKSRHLAAIGAKLLYFLAVGQYFFRKIAVGKETASDMSTEEAVERLEQASPRPEISFKEEEVPVNACIDLSVIIPVYNYASVLRECIDSVMQQKTAYVFEVFLVDDGSTDGSSEILRLYEHRKNVHILTQKNQGISAARNHALNLAAGRYFMFVDCDDHLAENAVERLLSAAYEKNCDIVEGAYYTFSEKTDCRRNYCQKPVFLPENRYDKLMEYTGFPWGKVFRRGLFRAVRFPEQCWFEDTLVKMVLFRRCERYCYIEDLVYGYRKYEGNFTETQIKSVRGIEHYYMIEWMLELSEKNQIGNHENLQLALLYHLGEIYRYRIESVKEPIQKAAFIAAVGLWKQYQTMEMRQAKLPYMYRELRRALEQKNYAAWKLACRYL